MILGNGTKTDLLTEYEIRELMCEALGTMDLRGRRVLILIPDGTRSLPLPLMFDLFEELLGSRVAALDYLVALGTHQPMSDAQLSKLVGRPVTNGQAGRSHIFNHEWANPANYALRNTQYALRNP